jgi:type I restriction enzyme S subunit
MESQILSTDYIKQKPRWDFRYFEPKYLAAEQQINTSKYPIEPLNKYVSGIDNFGAYSLCNLLEWVDEGIPYIRVTDLKEDGVNWETVPHIPPHVHEQLPKSTVLPRDVLYSMAGTIGLAVVAPDELGECNSNQAIAKIRLRSDELDPYYLTAFLNSRLGRYQSERIANGQTVLNINLGEIGLLSVPVPPHSEQLLIARVMQDAYSVQRNKLAEAANVEASVNDLVLQKLGINWSAIEDIQRFLVPSSAFVGKRFDVRYRSPQTDHALALLQTAGHELKPVGTLIRSISYGASVANAYTDEGIPFLRIGNLKPNFIDTANLVFFDESMRKSLGRAFVKEGDLLMSRSGSVGVVAVVSPQVDGFAFGSFQIKFRLHDDIVNPYYISYFLNSQLGKAQTEQQKTGSIQMNITIEGIKALRVPIPSPELQGETIRQADVLRAEAVRLRTNARAAVAEAKVRVEQMILGEE